jgi:hypothetical protein
VGVGKTAIESAERQLKCWLQNKKPSLLDWRISLAGMALMLENDERRKRHETWVGGHRPSTCRPGTTLYGV